MMIRSCRSRRNEIRSILSCGRLLFLTCLILTLIQASPPTRNLEPKEPSPSSIFRIIIDGGSTGSRLHLFQYHTSTSAVTISGSWKVGIPITAFSPNPNPQDLAAHLLPLFHNAAGMIPRAQHKTTRVQYMATAGMRLLSKPDRDAVYGAIYTGLSESADFMFDSLKLEDIGTLMGEDEGFFAAVSANYLDGRLSPSLHFADTPIGALDLGGSSCQLVFSTDPSPVIRSEDFFSRSYLSYGVDKARERVWENLVDACPGCDSLDYSCGFKGHLTQWKNVTLVGTGDLERCKHDVRKIISGSGSYGHLLRGTVGGIVHPEIKGEFMAMSNFFFGLDAMRVLSHSSEKMDKMWPTPTLDELDEALEGFCSRNWKEDMEEQTQKHAFTGAKNLPHRCTEAVYIISLLKDGFGFHPRKRDITFLFDIRGDEVEWTLGMALHNFAKDHHSGETTDLSNTEILDYGEGI